MGAPGFWDEPETAQKTVQAAINGTLQGLLIVKADLDREASRFSRRISDAPG